MNTDAHLQDLVVLLAAAVLVVAVVQRLRMSPVLGYLMAGAIVGPFGLGVVSEVEGAQAFAEIGVVILLFTIGLELSFERLRALRRWILGLGTVQVVACGTLIGGAGWLLGLPPTAAGIVGAALALSSTAIVMQLLSDQGDLIARVGRITFSVLLFQDLMLAPMLATIPVLDESGTVLALSLGLAIAKGVVAIVAITLVGRLVLQRFLHLVAETGNRELFVATVLLAAIGTGLATHAAGLSMALGAFLAGLVLAGSAYRHQVEADIEPFRGVLLGFFFLSVGMLIDPGLVLREPLLLLGLTGGLILLKGLVIAGLSRLFAIPWPLALRIGLSLSQGGEFAFVVLQLALLQDAVTTEVTQTVILVAALSMAATPPMASLGKRLALALEHRRPSQLDAIQGEARDLRDHVIIAGFGRVGQTIAHILAAQELPYVALDMDAGRVEAARTTGSQVFYGNAGQADVLRAAGIKRAKAVVITIDQPRSAERLTHQIRRLYPGLAILARAHDRHQGLQLEGAGATVVVPEILESSLQLGREVLRISGIDAEEADQTLGNLRARAYEALDRIVPPSGQR